MDDKLCLCDIKCGERCKVMDLTAKGSLRRRLGDLGIIKGTEIECVLKSPLGDPCAFLICGTLIALRKEDSRFIEVEVI